MLNTMMLRFSLSAIFLCLSACAASPRSTAVKPATSELEFFPPAQVQLLPSPFEAAQQKDIEYLLAMEPDRLLAPFLREAGLTPVKPSYGNWESIGLDGHIAGHYLTALALAYANTGDQVIKRRLDYMVDVLAKVQKANGNGYIGGVPGSTELWRGVAAGQFDTQSFGLNGAWVPWYNLHKTFAGLRDAYQWGGNDKAKAMFLKLCEWAWNTTKNLSDDQIQKMLLTEHGGMNEVLADAYALSGNDKYLAMAKSFTHRNILDPLMQSEDELTGLHANTQIPKVVGIARIAELDKDRAWWQAADYFWQRVTQVRSVAIGGNSAHEHFNPIDDFSAMIEGVEGPETCNTYNMLKLTEHLFAHAPQSLYTDWYERALYNHVLSTQDPLTGGLVYFTPMRPQHYRVYSTVDKSMWCCVGTGIENHLKYNRMIYTHTEDELWVNLWIPSRLEWKAKQTAITLTTQFPDSDQVEIVIEEPAAFSIYLRKPAWAVDFGIEINGKPVAITTQESGYVKFHRAWRRGDKITVSLQAEVRAERLPDGDNYYALLYGPVVLAAKTSPFVDETLDYYANDSRMGHVAAGRLCPLPEAPRFISESPDFYKGVRRIADSRLQFSMPSTLVYDGPDLVLEPFYRVHHSRYTIYFPKSTAQEFEKEKALVFAKQAEIQALQQRTLDKVTPGLQQPEVEHNFKAVDSESGIFRLRHYRHASGWFSYELDNSSGKAKVLRVTYNGLDKGRAFDILLNGRKFTTVRATGEHGDKLFYVDYVLPDWATTERAKRLEIKFAAHPGSVAGGVFDILLLSADPE